MEMTTRAAKAEGRATHSQDIGYSRAKTLVTQLEAAQRAENVKGIQINNLQNKIKSLETGVRSMTSAMRLEISTIS